MAVGQTKPRARDLGIPFDGVPGPFNAITDVKGVEVGHATLISGEGKLRVGAGPVRTGVTAVWPRGKSSNDPVFAGWFSLNGNGEMTGTTWVEESGFLDGPVMLTNTHSVGTVRDAVIAWGVNQGRKPGTNTFGEFFFSLPVVAETYDGFLNDINGFHVKEAHVFEAIESASPGPVAEGNVGGGTAMICYGYKGGIGTASRRVSDEEGAYTVGVLVQCNAGGRRELRVAGVPVGIEMPAEPLMAGGESPYPEHVGSIIIVVATDAPLLPHQLKRLARRASAGYIRTGSVSHNSSGDIFIAFSTANRLAAGPADAAIGAADPEHARSAVPQLTMLPNERIDPLFRATVEATEEAIINALVAAETMTGVDERTVHALPHERLRQVLKKYNRLQE